MKKIDIVKLYFLEIILGIMAGAALHYFSQNLSGTMIYILLYIISIKVVPKEIKLKDFYTRSIPVLTYLLIAIFVDILLGKG